MQIQWYPGHMEKARRAMQEKLKDVDLIIELVDARLPYSSRNPLLSSMMSGKASIIILTKKDRADQKESERWLQYFTRETEALLLDVLKDDVRGKVLPLIKKMLKAKIERALRRGIRNKTLRVMVVGIPNVGKSTFINRLTGRSSLQAENRPGVTRSLTQIRLAEGIELVDTPGVLWPKFEDEEIGLRLALVGSINDRIMDVETLALKGIEYLLQEYPGLLTTIYGISETIPRDILQQIGMRRGWLSTGHQIDMCKSAELFLNELRNNQLFMVSYEKAPRE